MHTYCVSQKELKYLEKIFHETNNYPQNIIKQILQQVQHKQNQQNVTVPTAAIADETNTNGKKYICNFFHIKVKRKIFS